MPDVQNDMFDHACYDLSDMGWVPAAIDRYLHGLGARFSASCFSFSFLGA